ncbi:hypothetical protein FA13DRAFT_1714004 [Coprinellus micaceus]|uniref:Uncharacterized protein n=1 Tax=Coprinellus micaceus TaxID=71717 RepID=A0A4Y7SU30_COPMI|nr:hypothetical protein FA13DRAFT_1714004 [Coprinellus micaceus]
MCGPQKFEFSAGRRLPEMISRPMCDPFDRRISFLHSLHDFLNLCQANVRPAAPNWPLLNRTQLPGTVHEIQFTRVVSTHLLAIIPPLSNFPSPPGVSLYMLSMKSPRPVRQHKGGPSNPSHYPRGNAGKGTRVRGAPSSSREADDPTDQILAELYPTQPRGPPASSRPRPPMAHNKEERMRTTIFSGPAITQQANAGTSNTATFGSNLGEAHMRSRHVEVQLGMHVLRCLELVGELASETQSRMQIHITNPHDLDFAKVDDAIHNATVGNPPNKPLGTKPYWEASFREEGELFREESFRAGGGTVQGGVVQGGGGTVQGGVVQGGGGTVQGGVVQGGGETVQGGNRMCGICQSSAPTSSSGMGSSHTTGARACHRISDLTQRFNQAEIRQVGIAFSLDPSSLTIPVSRMWLSGNREGHPSSLDLASILGSGPSVASLLVN